MELSLALPSSSMRRLFLYIVAVFLVIIVLNFGASFYYLPSSGVGVQSALRETTFDDQEIYHKYDLSKIDGKASLLLFFVKMLIICF